ncbi:MAG: sugar transferase [Crocinitomicaceae bacterium]|nr:sugar transferase [Crocinitomicaceae bacterium]MDG1734628.1 sugar transferase [Crocinitomicaceae bacterium]
MKRAFDIIFSLVVLIIFFPFGLLISIAILSSSRGGVFYRQERIGKRGKPFMLFKFRSMKLNADKKGKLTVGMTDSRITKIGVFIRKYKLDEFPQFINVLIGDMSVVGPRPEVEEFVAYYTDEQKRILDVKPGITDYASIEYFNENALLAASENPKQDYIKKIMPQKINLNQKYIKRPTLTHDLKIILRTVQRILKN